MLTDRDQAERPSGESVGANANNRRKQWCPNQEAPKGRYLFIDLCCLFDPRYILGPFRRDFLQRL